ncbi:MAG: 50S ribosomal protein L4 [Candidatus Nanoarchaeia archaeon]
MKLPVLDTKNNEVGKIELPSQFNEPVRKDLIKKAVEAIKANSRQPYGANPRAGLRQSAELSRRRHTYRGAYGHGISRVPRKILSRRGQQMYWVGAVAPGTVSGRRAHPPKSEKVWSKKMNVKERRMAIRSALSATVLKETVKERGHRVPDNYPFIAENGFENIEKTKEVIGTLNKLGFSDELERVSERKIRAGKGKLRGRKYKRKVGPLLVVSDKCNLQKAARNIPGVNVVLVHKLNAKELAPNASLGRCCIFTQKAVERLANENLFGGSK